MEVKQSIPPAIPDREQYNKVTVETPTIGPCAMSSEIPYSGKGAKNTAKCELLSPSERHIKTKKPSPHQRRQLQRQSTRAD